MNVEANESINENKTEENSKLFSLRSVYDIKENWLNFFHDLRPRSRCGIATPRHSLVSM